MTVGDVLESAVVGELSSLARAGQTIPDPQRAWTSAILTRLSRLARRLGFTPYTSKGNAPSDPDAGEWIYDLTWIKYDPQRYIRAVPMVLDSELGVDAKDRLEDFCKLILARAEHRVMIFGASNNHAADRITDTLIDEVENSGLTKRGDRYLFAALLEDDWAFAFRHHRARVGGLTARSTRRTRASRGLRASGAPWGARVSADVR